MAETVLKQKVARGSEIVCSEEVISHDPAQIEAHIDDTANPHAVTAAQVVGVAKRIDDTDSPYTVLATDRFLVVDTDTAAVTVNLPAGVNGEKHTFINVGSSGNDVTLDPNGTEQIQAGGAGVALVLADGEGFSGAYETTEGWRAPAAGGILEKFYTVDYVGDGVNSRILDLGDDYDEVEIRMRNNFLTTANHLVLAYANMNAARTSSLHGVSYNDGASSSMRHHNAASSDPLFQGIVTGDTNKIKLGTSAANMGGTNVSGQAYRITARKYSTITS